MMEESNDEQPEIVTHEEVALAEKEAAQCSAATPPKTPSSSASSVPTPSPLPSFLSSPSSTPSKPSLGSPQVTSVSPSVGKAASSSGSPSPVGVTSPVRSTPPRSEAPGPMQTPFEASSAIPVTASGEDQTSSQTSLSSAGSGFFGWFSNSSLVHRVVEKTKSSMESVITTLDPGMKEVIRSGGDVEIVVTSVKENKVAPVREAFQQTFGRATVTGMEGQASTAAQPVGFTAGLKGAEDRINTLRRSGNLPDNIPIVSIEGFIVELFPDRWYEMSCLVLTDPGNRIELQTCSQSTLIPTEYVLTAQDKTPSDYPLRWAGLAVPIGQVIEEDQPHIGRADWQKVLSGVSRRDSLYLAALTLAHMYKQRLPTSFIS